MPKKRNHAEFIEKFKQKQPKLFSELEILGEYVGNRIPILVKNKYGKCLIRPYNLLTGFIPGIQSAVNPTEYFINQAKEIHGELYDYSLVKYINNRTKVEIISKHGSFCQVASSHLQGCGCPILARLKISLYNQENPTGWNYNLWETAGFKSKKFDSFKVYIIKCFNNTEEFYKIGKTYKTVKQRFESKCELPYKWEVIQTIKGDAREISKLEHKLHKQFKEFKYTPLLKFEGSNECYSQINLLTI
jgi:hypothetical protein